jgi:hypothetical protein
MTVALPLLPPEAQIRGQKSGDRRQETVALPLLPPKALPFKNPKFSIIKTTEGL